jgi:hypothetical protein
LDTVANSRVAARLAGLSTETWTGSGVAAARADLARRRIAVTDEPRLLGRAKSSRPPNIGPGHDGMDSVWSSRWDISNVLLLASPDE